MVTLGQLLIMWGVESIHTIDVRTNMWVTWANQTGRDSFCLALQSATDPFRTCLIGVPWGFQWSVFQNYMSNTIGLTANLATLCSMLGINPEAALSCTPYKANTGAEDALRMAVIINSLNVSRSDPEELDLLGSVIHNNSTNRRRPDPKGTRCLHFGGRVASIAARRASYWGKNELELWRSMSNDSTFTYVSGHSFPCEVETDAVWNNDTRAKQLPPGVFLICGDRAWPGIPVKPIGRPCYLGKLTLFAPRMGDLLSNTLQNKTSLRKRRGVHQLEETCNSQVTFWNVPTRIIAALIPSILAAKTAKELERLACWTAKELNLTSAALSDLVYDVDNIRHAVLQNRAAIDFILLAQGHGCEELSGMCCFNLSSFNR